MRLQSHECKNLGWNLWTFAALKRLLQSFLYAAVLQTPAKVPNSNQQYRGSQVNRPPHSSLHEMCLQMRLPGDGHSPDTESTLLSVIRNSLLLRLCRPMCRPRLMPCFSCPSALIHPPNKRAIELTLSYALDYRNTDRILRWWRWSLCLLPSTQRIMRHFEICFHNTELHCCLLDSLQLHSSFLNYELGI